MRDVWRYRWRAAFLIQRRDMWGMLFSPAVYVTLTLALLASALIIRNDLNFVSEKGLLVLADPFGFPLLITALLSTLFLAISSTTTIARERDQGTLEVLFYGPVDHLAYVLGKYLAQTTTYLVMVGLYIPCFLLYAYLTNLQFAPYLIGVAVLSVFTASAVIAFGILVSTLTRTVRVALIIFLGVVLVFLVIQTAYQLLIAVPPPGRYYDPFLFLKTAVGGLNRLISWLSPFAHLRRGMTALSEGNIAGYLVTVLISAAYTAVLLSLSVAGLKWRGVRR